MIKIFFIVTAVWASILMGGISAERSLHTLQGNDHCDPEYPKLSLDLTSAPTSLPISTLYPFGVLNSVTAAHLIAMAAQYVI